MFIIYKWSIFHSYVSHNQRVIHMSPGQESTELGSSDIPWTCINCETQVFASLVRKKDSDRTTTCWVLLGQHVLVGDTYPSEKYERVSWDDYSQYMESHESHVPNHQPVSYLVSLGGARNPWFPSPQNWTALSLFWTAEPGNMSWFFVQIWLKMLGLSR